MTRVLLFENHGRRAVIARTTIVAAAALLALGLWSAPAQAVQIDLTSPSEGGVVAPGDEVEATVIVVNDTDEKDIVHVTFDLTVEIAGQPVYAATAKRRMKLAAGETVVETILVVVPEVELPAPALATVDALAKGRKSKTEDADSLSVTVIPLL
jgi:hypothetical protein